MNETRNQQGIRILRPGNQDEQQAYFGESEEIVGNRVQRLGFAELAASTLTVAIAETDAGAIFPWQYHRREDGTASVVEFAVILEGEGVIEVGEEGSIHLTFSIMTGDVVLIPTELVYRVRNTGSEPLRACIFFSTQATTYWADTRKA